MFFNGMRYNYPKEIKLGVALIILFALLSNAKLLKEVSKFDPKLIGRDGITLYEKRFKGLKKILPPNSIVGYITDTGELNQDRTTWQANADICAKFSLTQYALSPVIVTYFRNKSDFVVGNFHGPLKNFKFPEDRDFIVIKDFKNGVVLFKTKKK